MSGENFVYITRRNTVGQYEKPVPYPRDKFEERKRNIIADGWRIATKEEIARFYDVEELTPPKKKPSKKVDTPKDTTK